MIPEKGEEHKMGPVVYTLRQVNGDYAMLMDEDGGELMAAMALLPPGADEGCRIIWENFEYRLEG